MMVNFGNKNFFAFVIKKINNIKYNYLTNNNIISSNAIYNTKINQKNNKIIKIKKIEMHESHSIKPFLRN
jgi:hypothetical protein